MPIDRARAYAVLSPYVERGLLAAAELDEALALLGAEHPLARAAALASSIHLHVKVADTAGLPRAALAAEASVENEQPGYVKFAHPGGVNVIFSSISVAEEDALPASASRPKPFLDHVGLDLRSEADEVRGAFDDSLDVAKREGWSVASQGSAGKAVACCHTEVSAKHWLYPRGGALSRRPIELAFGPLVLREGSVGCDLRPIDPEDPRAKKLSACCAPSTSTVAPAIVSLGRSRPVG